MLAKRFKRVLKKWKKKKDHCIKYNCDYMKQIKETKSFQVRKHGIFTGLIFR